jgi:hypothetical protein
MDKDAIRALPSGMKYIVPESDYGKAEIWKVNDVYVLFSIPMYGGPLQYEAVFYEQEIDRMISQIKSWT